MLTKLHAGSIGQDRGAAPSVRRRVLVRGALAAVAGGTLASRTAGAEEPIVLHGAGATFPFPAYAAWIGEYTRRTGVQIVYDPVGSGAGIARFKAGELDFAATELIVDADTLHALDAEQVPTLVGGVVPVAHVDGIGGGAIRLTGRTLARIYLGQVSRWDDEAIRQENPGLDMPGTRITVVHRSDVSGTSAIWREYLARRSDAWNAIVAGGAAADWPVGIGAAGNEGVASMVKRTRMSIGYVEYAYALRHGLAPVAVDSGQGHWLSPSLKSIEAAARMPSRRVPSASGVDLLASGDDAQAWPISALSYVLVSDRPAHRVAAGRVRQFFEWGLTQGRALSEELGYVGFNH